MTSAWLLPEHIADVLPSEARRIEELRRKLLDLARSYGFELVIPPMLEHLESLLSGTGHALDLKTFKLVDQLSGRMLGVRADTTPQVARIATTRLSQAPRPLRLSYAGQCLRVRGSQLAPDRQIAQAGIELIGCDNPAADAEIVLVGAEALASVGLVRTSFDLTLPTLVPVLLDDAGLAGTTRAALARALDRKDAASVTRHGGSLAPTLTDLLLAAGPADRALEALEAANLPPAGRDLANRLAAVVAAIRGSAPTLRLTIDPVEFRGFRYETGVSVTIYAPGRHEELGRGGRYICGEAEPATGLTLLPDAVLRAAPPREARQRLYVPPNADRDEAARMRRLGYATIAALGPEEDAVAEARRLSCSHILRNGSAVPLSGT
jgi:ATP phosphoribosyltransferase regulatory subunit